MINWKKSYGEIHGELNTKGVYFIQDEKYYGKDGCERDGETGKRIEKNALDHIEVEEIPEPIEVPEEETVPLSWGDQPEAADLLLIDRVKIADEGQPGYLTSDELRTELDKLSVRYHPRTGRKKLLKKLVSELGLDE